MPANYVIVDSSPEETIPAFPWVNISASETTIIVGVPPFLTDQDPAPSATDTTREGPFQFRIEDEHSDVDLATVNVTVDFGAGAVPAVVNGVIQPAFDGDGAVVLDVSGVIWVSLVPLTLFPPNESITIGVDADDTFGNSLSTSYSFTTEIGAPPTCKLAECRIVSLLGSIIQLDARQSSSPDNLPLTFSWKFIQVPVGSAFEPDLDVVNPASIKDIRPSTYSAVSFIPDKLGSYLIELSVDDGIATSEACTALVDIGLSRSLCGVGRVPDAKFMWSFLSNFWSLVDDREYLETIWSAQIQLIGAEMLKLWSNDYNKSLDTIQQTVQRRWQKFDLHTELNAYGQRVIVGHTTEGDSVADTGEIGAPGAGTTNILHVELMDDDFTQFDVNYGAKGRIIEINGDFATISRVYNTNVGGTDYSVVLLDEDAVADSQANISYRVPHLIHVPGLDLEELGVSLGDTLVLEWTRGDTGATAEMPVRIVAVDRERIGFELTTAVLSPGDPTLDYDLFEQLVQDLSIVSPASSDVEIAAAANALIAFIPQGVNLFNQPFSTFRMTVRAGKIIHNTRLQIDARYISIPFLQEELKEDPEVILRENFDFFLEGGYLVFDSSLFSAGEPAPECLWAECTHVDNTEAIENNFGHVVELSKDDLVAKATRAPYLASVKGLWYAITGKVSIENIRLGLQILMGLPFAEARGKILDITNNFSTDTLGNPIGRILAEDVDDDDRGIGIRRFYFFPEAVGIEINPLTGVAYAVGDIVPAFAVLSQGIEVTDYVKDPLWWIRSLANNEIKKFFLFKAQIDTDSGAFDENDLVFSLEFINKIKPTYTAVVANVFKSLSDDVLDAFVDEIEGTVTQHFYDNVGHFGGHESTVRGNDYNHQGIQLWRGDSRPFSTRTHQTLRDIVTVKSGSNVWATSVTDFGDARARVTGAVATPTIEGDLLALWPNQPGAGVLTPNFYEIIALSAAAGPAVLNQAPAAEPTTMALDLPDADLFPYGTDLVGCVVRRAVNPKLVGEDLQTIAGAIQLGDSASADFVVNGVGIDDHLIIEEGTNFGEYRIASIVAQTSPRDYTPAGVPQISATQVGLVNLDGSNPALTNDTDQRFRVISPAMMRTRVHNAQIVQSGGNMFAEVLDPDSSFPFDVFTPSMVGATVVVQEAENPLNNGVYTIQASGYSNPGRVQITTGSPQTSDAAATAVVTIYSPYHHGFERAEELAPLEVFSAVVT